MQATHKILGGTARLNVNELQTRSEFALVLCKEPRGAEVKRTAGEVIWL
jgi:hypothetical protein